MADGPVPAPPTDGNRLDYDGAGDVAAKIAVTNSLLTLASLGVYRFWGKTRVRRYLWSRVSFLGDRVEYTGTGRELLLGFIAAIVVLGLFGSSLIGIQMAAGIEHPLYWIAQGIYSLALVFLVFVAEYRARRYRLSRTEWRGIRFAQDGSSLRYALRALGWAAATVLSLGIAYAVYRTRLQCYRTTHTRLRGSPFRVRGSIGGAAEDLAPRLDLSCYRPSASPTSGTGRGSSATSRRRAAAEPSPSRPISRPARCTASSSSSSC